MSFVNEHCLLALKHEILLDLIRRDSNTVPTTGLNPSLLPDNVFDAITVVMVIRNPFYQIPSIYESFAGSSQCQPGDEDVAVATSAKTYRLLFDVLRPQGRTATVVDRDDMLWRTEDLATKACAALGIDPASLTDRWAPIPESERPLDNPIILAWTTTIWESSGIERPAEKVRSTTIAFRKGDWVLTLSEQPDALSMPAEYKKWEEKYGEYVAKHLKEHVDASIPHYEHLRQFKI